MPTPSRFRAARETGATEPWLAKGNGHALSYAGSAFIGLSGDAWHELRERQHIAIARAPLTGLRMKGARFGLGQPSHLFHDTPEMVRPGEVLYRPSATVSLGQLRIVGFASLLSSCRTEETAIARARETTVDRERVTFIVRTIVHPPERPDDPLPGNIVGSA